jgi:uncharacterized protein
MIERSITPFLQSELAYWPAVALLGPRQVGKTTLALQTAKTLPHIYLDLESDVDRGKLAQPELYLSQHHDKLVILDEVHRVPGLFPVLRGLIDQSVRNGQGPGRYLLLGSASWDVLQQSGESLAGRIAYLELAPLTISEVGAQAQDTLWLRGGFPSSFQAPSHARSIQWRRHFLSTYMERDIPQLGSRIAAQTLRRFWTMLCHHQGGLLNTAQLARNIGVDTKTAASYIDLLCDLLLVRRLQPWHANVGKRLTKSPKVYVRDSGLVHALLGIQDAEALLSHMVLGASWEGFCMENILACIPHDVSPYFYRTSAGAEVDLLLVWPNQELWAIEIKRSLTPKVEKGFHNACQDLAPSRKWVVYPGQESYPLGHDVWAAPLAEVCAAVRK